MTAAHTVAVILFLLIKEVALQTCSRCNATAPDTAQSCLHCQADLREWSVNAVALKKFRENPRVSAIRISIAHDACPLCYESRGTFEKNAVPLLPHEGCSHPQGCRCNYAPVLEEIYP
ncbi:MAG: hypothetical protein DDG60_03940 [Anaerolineae bacterium]|nr:MAG: hypothetical protein DDG60_03940 [Anaerolineae bacterium]